MPRSPQVDRPDHVDAPSLASYAHGRLADAEMARIERHLGECVACCSAIEAPPADSLLALLRARGAEAVGAPARAEESAGPLGFHVPSSFEAAPTAGGARSTLGGPGPAADGTGPTEDPAIPAGLVDHPRYRVEAVLGAGGMGTVYLAEHRLMERPVALKVVRPDLVGRAALVDRFRREVRAAAKLAHPNIVTAYDAEQAGATQMLVMEYVRGTDLARVVRDRGPLPAAEACDLARQVALGLQHAHEHGMVHRDIKPQNLMLTAEGRVKVLDFGLARFASELPDRGGTTAEGAILGSADYMAPEQVEDPRGADIRSDLYSLGCTLYFLLAGRPPFPDGTIYQKLTAHALRTPAPLAEARADLPPGLAAVVGRLMAKDPAARFASPAAAAHALAPFAAGTVAGRGGGNRWRPMATAAAALLAVGLLAALTLRIRTPEGTLVVEVDDPAITVEVGANGRDVVIQGGGLKELRLRPGPHRVRATKDGRTIRDELVTIERDGKKVLHVQFEPDAAPPARPGGPLVFHPAPALVGPSPLDRIDPAAIPAEVRFPWQPKELVAVYGSNRQRHWGDVSALLMAPGGGVLASASDDRTVRLWDPATLKERALLAGHTDWIGWMTFTRDGRRLATAGGHADKTVRLWDVESGKELRRFEGHGLAVTRVAFSPDGRRLLSTSQDRTMRLWDAESGKEVRRWDLGCWAWTVAYAPDGRTAAVGSEGTIRRFEPETGKELPGLEGHKAGLAVRTLAFSPDGRRLVSGCDDGTVRLWDADGGREICRLDLPGGEVHGAAFSPDGRRALAYAGGAVLVFDGEAGGEVRRFGGHRDRVGAAAFAPDSRRVASGGDDRMVRVWDAETGAEIHRSVGHTGPVRCVAFAADGRHYYSGGPDNTVRLWDAETGREVRPIEGPVDETVAVAIAPDGRRVLSAGYGRVSEEVDMGVRRLDCPVRAWDAATGRETGRLVGHTAEVKRVVISADGRRALTGAADGTARLWDLASHRELHDFGGHNGQVRACDLSPDGRTALSGDDHAVRAWDVDSGRELHRLETGGWVGGVAFSPDGRRVLAGGGDRTLRYWEPDRGGLSHNQAANLGAITCVAFSPDGRDAYSGSEDKAVRRWPNVGTPTGGCVAFPTWHTDRVTSLAIAPDGKTLASADEGGRIVLWDAHAGTKRSEILLPGPVAGLAFAADGRHLATANGNGTAYLLRLAQAAGF